MELELGLGVGVGVRVRVRVRASVSARFRERDRRLAVCGVRLWRGEVLGLVARHLRLPTDLLARQLQPIRVWGVLRPGQRRGVGLHAEGHLVDPVAMVGVEPRVPLLVRVRAPG